MTAQSASPLTCKSHTAHFCLEVTSTGINKPMPSLGFLALTAFPKPGRPHVWGCLLLAALPARASCSGGHGVIPNHLHDGQIAKPVFFPSLILEKDLANQQALIRALRSQTSPTLPWPGLQLSLSAAEKCF